MKAIVIEEGALRLRTDVATPVPSAGQILVRIHATAVNYVDLMKKPAHFASGGKDAAAIPGLEFCGVVEAVGDAVPSVKPGDRVMAMEGGGYAEFACADHRLAIAIPAQMDWDEAAAVMVSGMTAHDALCTQGRMVQGDVVLVQGCTSSAGIMTAQLARAFGASAVIGTSTTPDKIAQMATYGVTLALDSKQQSVGTAVQEATDGRGANVIVDMVGASMAADNLAAAAIGARWVSVGRLNGTKAEIDLNEIARKRVSLIGVTFRTRSLEERVQILERFTAVVMPLINSGAVHCKIDRVFALTDADAAQNYVKSGRHFGKVILRIDA